MTNVLAFSAPLPLPTSRIVQFRGTANVSTHAVGRSLPRVSASVATPPPDTPDESGSFGIRTRTSVRAPVVDLRKSAAVEAHHWITVSSLAVRMFERAAIAHTDMVRGVEESTATGSLHRWVLRVVDDPFVADVPQSVNAQSRYVVMETYKPGDRDNEGVMRRWLSAVERLGPALSVPDAHTLFYSNVFTSKLHNAEFDVHRSVVMAESFSVNNADNSSALRDTLQSLAEESVAYGDCLEFCVLEALEHPGLFKTLEVYKDTEALSKHMNKLDVQYWEKLQPLVTHSSGRPRIAFKPVVFS